MTNMATRPVIPAAAPDQVSSDGDAEYRIGQVDIVGTVDAFGCPYVKVFDHAGRWVFIDAHLIAEPGLVGSLVGAAEHACRTASENGAGR